MPQIEVTFDLDANGILKVSAKDKGTGKEQNITIKGSSGLSDAEVEQMIKDAEANAEKDKTARELVEARNAAEAQAHAVATDLDEVKDNLTEDQVNDVKTAIENVHEAVKGDDKDVITQKVSDLAVAAQTVQQAKSTKDAETQTTAEDDVVDAEFTESA
jgi:molecular chaperone DnaK